jgi:hypothetical protein
MPRRRRPAPLSLAVLLAPLLIGEASARAPEPARPPLDPSVEMVDVVRHLKREGAVEWFPVASILASRETSCIDGRSTRPIVGSPGGDTGDLILTLAAWQAASGHRLEPRDVARLLDAYLVSFGTFYLHTDDHALDTLREALLREPGLAPYHARLVDAATTAAFIVSPELAEDAVAEDLVDAALIAPAHIGCGHLKLMRASPDAYGVAPELFDAVYTAIFRVARRRPDLIDFTRLEGAHRERAVVVVRVPNEVHAHTLVPGVVPALEASPAESQALHELFVHHPSVAAFMRSENAWFTIDETARLGFRRVPFAALTREVEALAERQLAATLAALAALHPVFEADISRDADGETSVRVRHLAPAAPRPLTH